MKLKIDLHDALVAELGGTTAHVTAQVKADEFLEFFDLSQQEIDLDKALAAQHAIAIVWRADDVRKLRPELTVEEAWSVLEACWQGHDRNRGLTNHVIEQACYDIFGTSPVTRAERLEQAVIGYGGEADMPANLVDLLTDARHGCDLRELDFSRLNHTAYEHYCAESQATKGGRK
jgi:hypothetical protein